VRGAAGKEFVAQVKVMKDAVVIAILKFIGSLPTRMAFTAQGYTKSTVYPI